MEDIEEEREEKRVVSLQPASTQKSRNFVRKISGPYIIDERLTTLRVG